MIITIEKSMDDKKREELIANLEKKGVEVLFQEGFDYDVLLLTENAGAMNEADIRIVDGVIDVFSKMSYHLASREFKKEDTIVDVSGVLIGQNQPIVMIAGPCSIESKESIEEMAMQVKQAGATMLRGGAFKPRTSPYAFQGLGRQGLLDLEEAGKKAKLPIVSEIVSEEDIALFENHVDMLQIGARNMQNYSLLKAVGRSKKPVLLKRGMSATVEEWILAAEYILKEGNPNVIFCERGIRTFEKSTRSTLDLSSIPVLKEKTHLPVVVDPSHAAGNWRYVKSLSLAAIACGADGLMVEVHDQPQFALSDGAQSLKVDHYRQLVEEVKKVAQAVGRDVAK